MSLPRVVLPEYKTNLPSNKKEIRYRPFLVKEQKILLMALETGEANSIIEAIFSIIESCVLTADANVRDWPMFDIEHLFLQMRARSVDNKIDVNLLHSEEHSANCDHATHMTIDIDQIELVRPTTTDAKIMITDQVGMTLRYPSLYDSMKMAEQANNFQTLFGFLSNCVLNIFDQSNVWQEGSLDRKELIEWLENLDPVHVDKIQEFIASIPYHRIKLKYTCEKCGVEEDREVKGITDFFI